MKRKEMEEDNDEKLTNLILGKPMSDKIGTIHSISETPPPSTKNVSLLLLLLLFLLLLLLLLFPSDRFELNIYNANRYFCCCSIIIILLQVRNYD